ncbi:Hypothetical predicted protein [Octopus vulgaris]|uniref:Uncharacterized protein n=1 Tax=Octopus vulgaris TaxID=6645 RepID=A0AA36FM86_OCTVU|nr:Hypothetical predicted protein [Octopus vulgaris]
MRNSGEKERDREKSRSSRGGDEEEEEEEGAILIHSKHRNTTTTTTTTTTKVNTKATPPPPPPPPPPPLTTTTTTHKNNNNRYSNWISIYGKTKTMMDVYTAAWFLICAVTINGDRTSLKRPNFKPGKPIFLSRFIVL